MSDKVNAARVAWALIKLSQVGTRPVSLARVAAQVGLAAEEALRLLRLTWREKVAVRDGVIHLDATPEGPRRYRVDADGRAVGAGKGCAVQGAGCATTPAGPVPLTLDLTQLRRTRP